MSWQKRKLGDVLTLQRGYDLPSSQRQDGEVPIISSSGITGYHNQAKTKGPGVVTGRYGTLGEVFYVKEDYWPLNTALYVRDFKGHDERFIAYFLKLALVGETGNKAAVPGVNRNDLHARDILITTSIVEQQKIASTLSAYDDLIANNLRRIELLENAARLIYKEWFIKLNFPGREHTKIVDGVPEGWTPKTVFDIAAIMSGGTPQTSVDEYWNGEIPFYTPKDSVSATYVLDTEKHLTEAGLKKCNSKLYPKDTLFITARGTVGNLNLAQGAMAMNQSCYALKGLGHIPQKYLYYLVKDRVEHIKAHSGGAVFNAVVVDTFKRIDCLIPQESLVRLFDGTVTPLFAQMENLQLQIVRLQKARDLLLPKLMSGQIAV